jgi:FAD/FMN-containing dehydrogenase
MPRIDPEAARLAARCRHYAMCKIDYLGTGLCASGPEKGFVTYYPQGRMDLVRGLAEGRVPVTEALLEAADTCTMCGVCDGQCHFVTGMRPTAVMRALKDHVAEFRRGGGEPVRTDEDEPLRRLRSIVGREGASNDPAVLWTYADDPFPLTGPRPPRYVVLPRSRDEVAAIVRLAGELGLPYAVRGSGGSVFGLVFTDGIVLDMARMRRIDVDRANWCAAVEPGVTSFELQQEAQKHGVRVNAAEPAATVCGNIICTGTFSTWSHAYGTNLDNFVDMEFVGRDGGVFRLNDRGIPNPFGLGPPGTPPPGVCTRAFVKLHPVPGGEEGILVPFEDLDGAVGLARELGTRRIGSAVAVLGAHYIATFLSPDEALAKALKAALPEALGINYGVLVIADRFGREAVQAMASTVIDSATVRLLMLGLPRLVEPRWLDLVREWEGRERPYELLGRPELRPLIEAALQSSPETVAEAVAEPLRPLYRDLYARPEMTDLVWLSAHRIVSARMARHKHVLAFLVYLPPDRIDVVREVLEGFARIAEAHGLDHDFGFLTPLDLGKRAILEYDYYLDHTDPVEKEKAARALADLDPWLADLSRRVPSFLSLKDTFAQGCVRKEIFLYRA